MNTIKLTVMARRKELEIMKLSGPNPYKRTVCTEMFIGIVGAGIAYFIVNMYTV